MERKIQKFLLIKLKMLEGIWIFNQCLSTDTILGPSNSLPLKLNQTANIGRSIYGTGALWKTYTTFQSLIILTTACSSNEIQFLYHPVVTNYFIWSTRYKIQKYIVDLYTLLEEHSLLTDL